MGNFSEADAALTREIGIFDAHSDLVLGLGKLRERGIDDSLRTYWLPRLRAGGVKVVVCAIYIDSVYLPEGALRRAVQLADALLEEIAANPEEIALASTGAEARQIIAAGKIAVILAFEGAEPLGMDLSTLRLFHRLGLRMLSFAWMRRTAFGDGTWENDSGGGLTRLGKQAVKEMERLRILVDVSHASDRTTWDILACATRPVVASHSNARMVHDHPRNLTDEQIRAIAASGGVVGAVAVARFVSDGDATIARWVDHIDYLVEVAGIDHVGIGADFFRHLEDIGANIDVPVWNPDFEAPQTRFPEMLNPDDLPGLTAELVRRGYTTADLRKIFLENFLRVFTAVTERPG
jgi:membrane dipeptidase